jgi:hypothetical protein
MEPEDEAFEELALKQGSWQYTSGWRKKQIQVAQPEQEPHSYCYVQRGTSVDILTFDGQPKDAIAGTIYPLYTAPPQRTWVGLTKKQISKFEAWHDNREEEVGWVNPSEIVAYIEAKLKEKNT